MRLDDGLGDGQPQPRFAILPAARRVAAVEAFEDVRQGLRHEPCAEGRGCALPGHLQPGGRGCGRGGRVGAVGAYIGGPSADYFTANVPSNRGLGYVLLFALYGVMFIVSIVALRGVREVR